MIPVGVEACCFALELEKGSVHRYGITVVIMIVVRVIGLLALTVYSTVSGIIIGVPWGILVRT